MSSFIVVCLLKFLGQATKRRSRREEQRGRESDGVNTVGTKGRNYNITCDIKSYSCTQLPRAKDKKTKGHTGRPFLNTESKTNKAHFDKYSVRTRTYKQNPLALMYIDSTWQLNPCTDSTDHQQPFALACKDSSLTCSPHALDRRSSSSARLPSAPSASSARPWSSSSRSTAAASEGTRSA